MEIFGYAFIVGLVGVPVWAMTRVISTRKDQNAAEVWRICAVGLLFATIGLSTLGIMTMRDVFSTVGTWLITAGFGAALVCEVAYHVTKYLDRRADNSRRHALGLEPRKRLVHLPLLTAVWVVIFFGGSMAWVYGISELIEHQEDWSTARDLTTGEFVALCSFPALALMSTAVHVPIQRRRINKEEERLHRLDMARAQDEG